MRFTSALLCGASLIAAAVAQNTTLIAFTTLPGASVQAGVPVKLAWSGGDGVSPVTITLKQGPQTDLATVAIITGDATGNTYTWTPSSSLPNANDYALQISQGIDDINYTGTFSLTGGSTSTSSSSSTSTSASATTAVIIAGPSGNATIVNPTFFTTTLAGTAASSGGTGIPMSRNTTFATASLSTTAGTAGGGVTAGPSGTPTGTTGTQGGGGTPTGTAGSTGASPSSTSAADAKVVSGSSLALVLCAVVGMWMLN
ncbi:hypothetical protein MMC34_006940 [Xylographa carneopallida]|nr:hypothetical protein [Xylographa carneopallida]